jgi:hypothetical protein
MATNQFIINIKAQVKPIIKLGFAFQGFVIILAIIGFFFMGYFALKDSVILAMVCFAIAIFFYFVSRKYFDNVFLKEQISIEGDNLIVLITKGGNEKKYVFELDEIKYLGHVGGVEYTEHPMNNKIVDFTGLGTSERELQYLIDDGTIEITTETENLRFGKNMTSWETEEVIEQLEAITKRKFSAKPQENDEEQNNESETSND